MGKIIVPGQRTQEDYKNEIQALPDREIILAMYQDAKKKGMDFRDYLAEQIDRWNDEDYIRETYEQFLRAVQNGDEKPFPNENGSHWNEHSTFVEWLWYVEQTLKIRLEKLAEERRNLKPSFENLGRLREELGDHSDQLNLTVEGAGETPPKYILDFYEEVMRKSLEALSKFRRGLVKLPPQPSWGNIDNPEAYIDPMSEEEFKKYREMIKK